jgi:hypothetical protein
MDMEIIIAEKERVLARQAEEIETNNHRLVREQRHQRELKDEAHTLKKRIQHIENQIDTMRVENAKRRETQAKKEIAIIEKAKRNALD